MGRFQVHDINTSNNYENENPLLLHLGLMCNCYILSKEIKFRSFSKGTITDIFNTALYYHEISNDKQLFVI